MLKVGNVLITTPVISILQILKQELDSRGIQLLHRMVKSPSNIQVTCPVHNGGQERKPSCGISTKVVDGYETGTVHCFTCGYRATFPEFVSTCFGRNDGGEFGKHWLVRKFISVEVSERPVLQLDFSRSKTKQQEQQYISEEELDSYRYTHPYLYQRGMTDEIIEKYDLGYDPYFRLKDIQNDIETITFPVRDINGNTLFIARRAIHQKLFHYPVEQDKPIYGIYELDKNASEVIVCESMFNALTCQVYGKQAVALLGLGTQSQYEQLAKLPCRELVIGLDPDSAGFKAGQKLKEKLRGRKIISFLDVPQGKDINDLSVEEFNKLVKYY